MLSKKEIEEKERIERARQNFINQGLIDTDAIQENKTGDAPKQRVYGNKKKKNKNKKIEEHEQNDEQVVQDKENTKEEEPEVKLEVESDKDEDKDQKEDDQVDEVKKPEEPAKTEEVEKVDIPEKVEEPQETTEEPEKETPKVEVQEDEKQDESDDGLDDDWEGLLEDDEKIEKQVKAQVEDNPEKLDDLKQIQHEESQVEEIKTENVKTQESKFLPYLKNNFVIKTFTFEIYACTESNNKPKPKPKQTKEVKESAPSSIFERKGGKKKNKKRDPSVTSEESKTTVDSKSERKLRCPIVCVLGHVDTGKTLLLDKIRKTNVQRGEAGGITQQIGATYFPGEALQNNIDKLDDSFDCKEVKIPGLLVIDTPGHESFTNLRSRGSGLCDLAVLVVDIMHGLEQQTLESIELLKQKKTPFIVALNKIDRCHMWESEEYRCSRTSIDIQHQSVIDEYETRRDKAFLEFNTRGMNIIEYWNNEDYKTYISAVPTSAMTGEGIPDILGMIVKFCQTKLKNKVTERNEEFQCTVLEVKKISGIGTTVDVVLVNGRLAVGDTIVLAGFNGPIVTKIRALLTPQPMKEIRVKGEYLHHEELYGAMGIKISAPDLDYALAGGELYKADYEDQIDDLCDEIQENMLNFADKYVNAKDEGVCVQASTLGSLEALLEFLKSSKIPVCSVNIGPIYKKDVMKALKFIEDPKAKKEFAAILAFDVPVDDEAREYAVEYGIEIFTANIIYHLFDQFTEYVAKCKAERKKSQGAKAVFPCAIEIIKDNIFHKTDPILLGVNVKAGVLKLGTPLCVPDNKNLKIGYVDGIQKAGKDVNQARSGDGGVSVKIHNDKHISADKHFNEKNQLVSLITRDSIDALKMHFKDEMTMDDWKLVKKLKEYFQIP